MKKSGQAAKGLLIAFYAVLSVTLFLVIVVSIGHPLNNLFPWQMAVGSVTLAGVFLLLMKYRNKIPKIPVWGYIIFLILFGTGLFVICILHGNHYHFAGDYEIFYISATEAAEGRQLSYDLYFRTYGNNTIPMLLLSAVIKIAGVTGIDEFYLLLPISIGLVLSATWAIGYLLDLRGLGKFRVPAAVVMAACLPVYVFTNTFYTDTMTFGIGITATALLVLSYRAKKAGVVYAVLASVLVIWGANWKITCIIPLIALACVELADSLLKGLAAIKGRNVFIANRNFLIFAACAVILQTILFIAVSQTEIYKLSKRDANPVTTWIAMGMMNDGSYSENVAFSDTVNTGFDTKEQKAEFVKQTMKEHIGEAFSFGHISAKIRRNFASGTFSASDYTVADGHGSLFYNLLDPGGAHYWRACQYCFIYIFAIYLVMLYTGILILIGLIGKKETDVFQIVPKSKLLADVAFFGLFLFLLIWEANNRQLYNALPVLILALFGYFTPEGKKSTEKE